MSLICEVYDKGSEIVVSSTYLFKMGPAAKSSIRIINERGPSQDPSGMPPTKVDQVESSSTKNSSVHRSFETAT